MEKLYSYEADDKNKYQILFHKHEKKKLKHLLLINLLQI